MVNRGNYANMLGIIVFLTVFWGAVVFGILWLLE